MQGMYSMRSPAVKRLMKEAQELSEPTEQYECHPLEDNLFEWHFTIRGPADSEFDGGLYHGRIVLPPEYPMKPPSIILLTPNGRFETNKKICLSISGHHPESWQPSWSLRTALLAIIGFMPTHGAGALGSLDYTPDERKVLAKRSQDFKCPSCGKIDSVLKPVTEESKKTTEEARELASQIDFKNEKEKNAALKSTATAVETDKSQIPAAETNTEASSTPTGASMFTPPPFSQFPFRLPFVPPFPRMAPPSTSSGVNPTVPRFPLPFMSPFFPPMMYPGNIPPLPMMPGVPMPPWQQQTTAIPPATPPRDTAFVNPNSSSSQNITSENRQNSETVENVSSGSTSTENRESSSTNPSSSNPEGVRHRNVAPRESVQTTSNTPQSTQRNSQYQTRPGDRLLIVFAVFVVLVIVLLVLRRLHMMKLLTFF